VALAAVVAHEVGEVDARDGVGRNVPRGRDGPRATVVQTRAPFDGALRLALGQRDGRLLAGLLGNALGAIFSEPFARSDKACKRLRKLGDQSLARGRRQFVPLKHRLADRGEMAVTRNDAVERERRDVRVRIFDENETGFSRADLGNGG
jgi:hypothetical protein